MATTNYEVLQTRADELAKANIKLHAARTDYSLRENDVIQNQALYDSVHADYERRKAEGKVFLDELTRVNALVTDLKAKQAALRADKDTKITARNTAWDALYDDTNGLEKKIDVAQGNVLNEQNALDALYTSYNAASTILVDARESLQSKTQELEEKNRALAVAQAAADGYPSGTVPATLTAEIASLQGTIATLTSDIATLNSDIVGFVSDYDLAKSLITAQKAVVATAVAAVRTLQGERDEKKAAYDKAVFDLLVVANELQLVEGTAETPTVPSTIGYPAATAPKREMFEDANVVTGGTAINTTTGFAVPGSKLYVAIETQTAMVIVDGAYNDPSTGLVTQLLTSDADASTELADAKADLTTSKTALKSAEDEQVASRSALDAAMESQKLVEVDAAISLLKDFLKNMDLVIAGGPTLDETIVPKINETCPSSKVRTLVEDIRNAYADPATYKALLASMCADPVAVFLNAEPHCFDELSIEDSAKLQAAIRDTFIPQAKALLKKYGACPSSGLSFIQILLILLVVVAVIAVGYYLLVRA